MLLSSRPTFAISFSMTHLSYTHLESLSSFLSSVTLPQPPSELHLLSSSSDSHPRSATSPSAFVTTMRHLKEKTPLRTSLPQPCWLYLTCGPSPSAERQ